MIRLLWSARASRPLLTLDGIGMPQSFRLPREGILMFAEPQAQLIRVSLPCTGAQASQKTEKDMVCLIITRTDPSNSNLQMA